MPYPPQKKVRPLIQYRKVFCTIGAHGTTKTSPEFYKETHLAIDEVQIFWRWAALVVAGCSGITLGTVPAGWARCRIIGFAPDVSLDLLGN